MRICVYDEGKLGLVRDGLVRDVSAVLERLPPARYGLRKSLDTYSVLGPWLVTADEPDDSGALDLALDVNGEARQRANTRDLIIDVPDLIEFASAWYTLEPGDVVFTGTPAGVGPIVPGDGITASIGRIGSMEIAVHG